MDGFLFFNSLDQFTLLQINYLIFHDYVHGTPAEPLPQKFQIWKKNKKFSKLREQFFMAVHTIMMIKPKPNTKLCNSELVISKDDVDYLWRGLKLKNIILLIGWNNEKVSTPPFQPVKCSCSAYWALLLWISTLILVFLAERLSSPPFFHYLTWTCHQKHQTQA